MRKSFAVSLCFIVTLPASAFAARFANAERGLDDAEVWNRCQVGDQLNNNDEASARIEWAVRCGVIPQSKRFSLTSDFDDAGNKVPATKFRYPTFAYPGPGNPVWVPNLGSCDVPATVRWYSVCVAGCYQADQMVRYSTGDVEIGEAFATKRRDLVTLKADATLDDLQFEVGSLGHYTADPAPQTQTIVSLFAQSGGFLKVTTNHPIVRDDGVMVTADKLRTGDALLREDGSSDKIIRIETDELYTQVYNVSPATSDTTSNIVIAQGYLNGSGTYQNEYARYLNGVVLRASVPADILE